MNTNNNCNKEDYSMDDLAAAMGSKLLEGGGTAKKRLIPNPQGQISGNIVETVLNYKLSHLNVPNCDKEAIVIPTDSNNINIADDDIPLITPQRTQILNTMKRNVKLRENGFKKPDILVDLMIWSKINKIEGRVL